MASYHRKERRKFKQQVGLSFLQAEVTARYVSLQKGDPLPEPWEYYPTLFEDRKTRTFEQEKLERVLRKAAGRCREIQPETASDRGELIPSLFLRIEEGGENDGRRSCKIAG